MNLQGFFQRTALTLIALWPGAAPAAVSSFSDITLWIGTGVNQSALIIDWNDGLGITGPNTDGETLAWGFRWNGTAPTSYDMLLAIDAADTRLQLEFRPPGAFGQSIFGIGYDLDGDGGTFTFNQSPGNEQGVASDSDDHVAHGWFSNGSWSHLQATPGGPSLPAQGDWGYTGGISSRTLSNGSWDALTFSSYAENPEFDLLPPSNPVIPAVPEPSATLLAAAGLALAGFRRRR